MRLLLRLASFLKSIDILREGKQGAKCLNTFHFSRLRPFLTEVSSKVRTCLRRTELRCSS
jgi:hypothetical protein